MAVNPDKHPGVNYDMAMNFVKWITSVEEQKVIGSYGVDKFGQPLFYPSSKEYKDQSQAPSGGAALTVTGAVDKELKLAMAALKGMEVVKITAEHPKTGTETDQGVRLNALLDQANVKADAKSLIFTAGDGYTAEVSLADARQCTDCLIAFTDDGKLKTVMPGMQSKFWVKDVVKIEAK
jgi:DMSO/TMAO reductase YedYZ molybdopterin-dependent catalytic subunit